jgi:hypothetical protein
LSFRKKIVEAEEVLEKDKNKEETSMLNEKREDPTLEREDVLTAVR